MLYNAKSLIDCKIQAIDGEIGNAEDFYFDDRSWAIRYMVVNTGGWIEGKQVLLSPVVINKPDMSKNIISVKLTREQIRNSPDIDTKKPVYLQHENDPQGYYQWPIYGMSILPPPVVPLVTNNEEVGSRERINRSSDDPHLRSANQIIDYKISALDGEIGHVENIIVNDEAWTIHYIIVKTKTWLPGKKIPISPHWINLISWEDQKVYVDMTMDSIKNSPEYDPSKPIFQDYENELRNYYGK